MSLLNEASEIDRQLAFKGQELNKFLCFFLGKKSYGINILSVKEIIEHTEVTPVPMMPDFFLGAINLRGRMVPVIDIARRLGMVSSEVNRRTCIVITEVVVTDNSTIEIGMLVDGVSQVSDIPPEQIEPAPTYGEDLKLEFIYGMGKIDNTFTILLRVEKVLSMNDLQMIRQTGNLDSPTTQAVQAAFSQISGQETVNQDKRKGDENA